MIGKKQRLCALVGMSASLVATAGPAMSDSPVLEGSLTSAYLWSQVNYTGATDRDGFAIVADSHREEGGIDTQTGWYVQQGTVTSRVLWGAQTTVPAHTRGICTTQLSVEGQRLLDPSPNPSIALWFNPWMNLDLYELRMQGGSLITGPVWADLVASPSRHLVQASLDCAELGTAVWDLPLIVLPSPDPDRPEGVSINDGSSFTNNPKVTLTFGWDGLVDKIRISNDGGFAPSKSSIRDLSSGVTQNWTLDEVAAERIPRQVYVKLHSVEQGWQKQTYTDDIILDTIKPQVLSASLSGSGAASLASGRMVRIRAKDNRSGIASMQVSKGKPSKRAKVVKYRKAVKVAGSGPLFVRVRDGAGNGAKGRVAG